MLIDRALQALIFLGTGAARGLLRRLLGHLPDALSGEPGNPVSQASTTVDDVTEDDSGHVIGLALPQSRQRTVTFGLDGQAYEIDLDADHAEELRAAFQRYIDAGRQVGHRHTMPATAGSTRPGRTAPTTERNDTAAIRAWARAHGHQVSDRGRISAAVLEAYEANRDGSRRSG
jgi:hypothetical protein